MNRQSVLVGRALALSVLYFVTVVSLCGHVVSPLSATVHCVAGGLLLLGSGVHLAGKPGWVKMLFARPASSLPAHVRRGRAVARWLVVAGCLCALSGVQTAAHPRGHAHAHAMHALTGAIMIGLLGAHVLMHRRWLRDTVRRLRTRDSVGERTSSPGSRP